MQLLRLHTVRTDASGIFVVPVSGGEPGTVVKYRVVRAGETLARRKVITVAQTATLSAPTAPYGNQVRMTATFTPARPGRRVGLLGNGGWMQGPKSQNASGQVTFWVTLGPGPLPGAPVRADAYPYNGAPDIFTNVQYVPPNIVTP